MLATRPPLGLHDPSFCLYLACLPFLLLKAFSQHACDTATTRSLVLSLFGLLALPPLSFCAPPFHSVFLPCSPFLPFPFICGHVAAQAAQMLLLLLLLMSGDVFDLGLHFSQDLLLISTEMVEL